MTKAIIDKIMSDFGGEETVIGTMYFEIFLDNPRQFAPDAKLTKEERIEQISFNDELECLIIKQKNQLPILTNDYTPLDCTMYIPYDDIQGIYVYPSVSKVSFEKKEKE